MEENINKKETRNERFKRIATKRTRKILDALRLLGNCSNKIVYSYTDEEVNKIFSAIEEELKIVKSMFVKKKDSNFEL